MDGFKYSPNNYCVFHLLMLYLALDVRPQFSLIWGPAGCHARAISFSNARPNYSTSKKSYSMQNLLASDRAANVAEPLR